jgi:hypothetical protein
MNNNPDQQKEESSNGVEKKVIDTFVNLFKVTADKLSFEKEIKHLSNPGFTKMETLLDDTRDRYYRKCTDFPIHIDFPRLFPFISVVNEDKSVVWKAGEACYEDIVGNIFKFFTMMDDRLSLGYSDDIEEKFFQYIPKDCAVTSPEIPIGLKGFVSEVLTDNSPITSILKTVNQSILVPAVTVLRVLFMSANINYVEMRGKWDIIITVRNDNTISVINKRWERSHPELFQFCWNLEFIIQKNSKELQDVKLYISSVVFQDMATDDDRMKVMSAVKDIYSC